VETAGPQDFPGEVGSWGKHTLNKAKSKQQEQDN
jgi:hypothetical protein